MVQVGLCRWSSPTSAVDVSEEIKDEIKIKTEMQVYAWMEATCTSKAVHICLRLNYSIGSLDKSCQCGKVAQCDLHSPYSQPSQK